MDIPGEKTTHLVMDKFLTAEEKQNSAEHLTKLEDICAGEWPRRNNNFD